ncbi:MAG: hypothetical protein KJT03_20900, partial [Verrucomicrobiae bacterium]|nr:hypothetical protein [Verrucomicrobiae bacterium]
LVEHFPAKDLLNVVEIRHSPWVRAQKTASEFCKLAGLKADLREVPLLEPYADFRILADIISATDKDLILVGHEPSLGMLASYLLSQENQTDIIRLKKGGMLFLERMETANVHNNMRNFWQLRWMMSPRDFLK